MNLVLLYQTYFLERFEHDHGVSRFLGIFSAERFYRWNWSTLGFPDFQWGHDRLGWGDKTFLQMCWHTIFMSSWGGAGANNRSERALRSGYDATLAYVPCYGNWSVATLAHIHWATAWMLTGRAWKLSSKSNEKIAPGRQWRCSK